MSSEEQQPYKEAVEKARRKLKSLEDSKQQTIRDLALEIESFGIPPEEVGAIVIDVLEGYVSERYIRECLDKKYKKKHTNYAKTPADVVKIADGTSSALSESKKVPEEEKKPIIIDTQGRAQENEISDEEDHRSEPQIRDQVEASMMRAGPTLEAELNALRKEVEELKEMIRTLETERDEFKEIAAKKNLVEATQLMPKPGEIRMKARDFNDVVQIAALSRQEIRIEHDGLRAVKLVRITGGERR